LKIFARFEIALSLVLLLVWFSDTPASLLVVLILPLWFMLTLAIWCVSYWRAKEESSAMKKAAKLNLGGHLAAVALSVWFCWINSPISPGDFAH